MAASLDLTGDNLVARTQPGVRSDGLVPGVVRGDSEVEGRRDPASPEHPLRGDGLRQADESQRDVPRGGLDGPGNLDGHFTFRGQVFRRSFHLLSTEFWGETPKWREVDERFGAPQFGERLEQQSTLMPGAAAEFGEKIHRRSRRQSQSTGVAK